jgi:hypothetical protein
MSLTTKIVSGNPPTAPRPRTTFEEEQKMAALFGIKLRPPRNPFAAREPLQSWDLANGGSHGIV